MTVSDPYRIEAPATISFSGGRTSAFMLWNILQAHGGELPENLVVVFANTGKERPETLAFVNECSKRWAVKVHWVEWRVDAPGFAEVTFETASRNGEPFAAMIDKKKYLPNWSQRFCTQLLKVEVMGKFLASIGFEPKKYTEIIGLRADEMWRVAKMVGRNAEDGMTCTAPLAKAGQTKREVMAFWATQDFDLGLKSGEGNCDLCFMKGRGLRKALIKQNPASADWWAEQEAKTGGFFDKRDRYALLAKDNADQPDFFVGDDDAEECGLICATAEQVSAA